VREGGLTGRLHRRSMRNDTGYFFVHVLTCGKIVRPHLRSIAISVWKILRVVFAQKVTPVSVLI
jgi:hypothetical protein